jgi:hypothetical protein
MTRRSTAARVKGACHEAHSPDPKYLSSMADQPLNAQGDIPEFHRLTGEAIRLWANIETHLSTFVGMILDVDQFRARIVMGTILGSRARREFVTRLAETYVDPASLPTFRGLMRRLKTLAQTRNTLAHTPMHVNVDGRENLVMGDVFSEAMDGGLDFDFHPFPLNDLRVFVRALEVLQGELMRFVLDCDGHVYQMARVHREEQQAKEAKGPGNSAMRSQPTSRRSRKSPRSEAK